jgi:hypothetical protein
MCAARSDTKTQPLPLPDLHFLHWAEGWLDLGNSHEAHRELEQIRPDRRGHPDVLSLRWQIYAEEQHWSDCFVLALSWTERWPTDPRGWIALAQTFYHRKQIADAYSVCVAKATDFPECWELLYNTARYACLLGRLTEAMQYVQVAMVVGDPKDVRQRALNDPDLTAIFASRKVRRSQASPADALVPCAT